MWQATISITCFQELQGCCHLKPFWWGSWRSIFLVRLVGRYRHEWGPLSDKIIGWRFLTDFPNNNVAGFSLIMSITWSLAYGCGQQQNWRRQKTHFNCWQFWLPCGYGGAMRGTSPNGAHPWLHAKPLDAAIGQVPMRYCPGGRHSRWFWTKQKKTNKR